MVVEVSNNSPESSLALQTAGPDEDDIVSGSWLGSWCQWSPTSMSLLRAAESRILQYIKRPFEAKYINIGSEIGETENKIWTLMLNKESKKTPLVMLHGFASGVGLWCLNLDNLSAERPVYAIDLLGFGRSSRPKFSSNALEAENQIVQSIEEWRKQVGLDKFALLGHSMGGFLASAYALQYPDRISHLILADPWGFPELPNDSDPKNSNSRLRNLPFWVKGIAYLLQPFNPLWILRVSGPLGPRLVQRARPDIFRKFSGVIEDADSVVASYIYHCNAQNPTGESAFHAMMASFGWAKFPMLHRIPALKSSIPITFIYGARSWIDRFPGQTIKEMRNGSSVDIHIIKGAGHHVYAEPDEFNALVEKACDSVDQSRGDFYESKVTVFRRGEKIDEMQQSLETEVLEESKY